MANVSDNVKWIIASECRSLWLAEGHRYTAWRYFTEYWLAKTFTRSGRNVRLQLLLNDMDDMLRVGTGSYNCGFGALWMAFNKEEYCASYYLCNSLIILISSWFHLIFCCQTIQTHMIVYNNNIMNTSPYYHISMYVMSSGLCHKMISIIISLPS